MGAPDNRHKEIEPLATALKNNKKTAVVCMDDNVAQLIIRELDKKDASLKKDLILAYIGFLRPQYEILENIPAFIGAVDFRELGREGLRLLEERIEKGPGRAVCRRIPGTVIEWKGE